MEVLTWSEGQCFDYMRQTLGAEETSGRQNESLETKRQLCLAQMVETSRTQQQQLRDQEQTLQDRIKALREMNLDEGVRRIEEIRELKDALKTSSEQLELSTNKLEELRPLLRERTELWAEVRRVREEVLAGNTASFQLGRESFLVRPPSGGHWQR